MTELPDFDTDTAISADLDDELVELASDMGIGESTLRDAMVARPGYAARRRSLEAARSALRTPIESLDELTRARLVATAARSGQPVPAGRGARPARGPAWTRLAAAAAVVVVVAAGAAVLVTRGGNDTAKSSAAGGSVRTGKLGDLGAIDQRKLEELIGARPPASSTSLGSAATGSATDRRTAQSASGTNPPVPGFDSAGAVKPTAEQVHTCEREYGAQGPLRFTATGAYLGRAAVVLGIANGERTIVFVVAADDCAQVLFSVSR